MPERLVKLTVYLPPGLKADLEWLAERRRRSLSFLVRDFVEERLKEIKSVEPLKEVSG